MVLGIGPTAYSGQGDPHSSAGLASDQGSFLPLAYLLDKDQVTIFNQLGEYNHQWSTLPIAAPSACFVSSSACVLALRNLPTLGPIIRYSAPDLFNQGYWYIYNTAGLAVS